MSPRSMEVCPVWAYHYQRAVYLTIYRFGINTTDHVRTRGNARQFAPQPCPGQEFFMIRFPVIKRLFTFPLNPASHHNTASGSGRAPPTYQTGARRRPCQPATTLPCAAQHALSSRKPAETAISRREIRNDNDFYRLKAEEESSNQVSTKPTTRGNNYHHESVARSRRDRAILRGRGRMLGAALREYIVEKRGKY